VRCIKKRIHCYAVSADTVSDGEVPRLTLSPNHNIKLEVNMAEKRKGLRSKFSGKALLKRTEEAHQRINEYGKFGRFYAAKGEKPLKIWKCKEGEHIIDIIPFLAGSQHHQVHEGEPTYLLDVWVHQKVGMDENDIVCLARNYNEACPICEYLNAKRLEKSLTEEDEAVLKVLNPKRRCLYNIICYDSTREEDRGVQLWEVAHFLFEKKILSVARNPRGGGFTPFSSPDNGKSIYFEREGSGVTNTQYLGHKFIERQTAITDETLGEAYILDELLTKLNYDEMKDMFLGGLVKLEKKVESDAPGTPSQGDDIPEETNRIAQRLEASKQKKGSTTHRSSKPPLKSSAQEQRPASTSQQKRPTGNKRPTGQRSAQTQQKRSASTQQRRPAPTQQRRPAGGQGAAPTQRRRKPQER
jgi:hypothetical protein